MQRQLVELVVVHVKQVEAVVEEEELVDECGGVVVVEVVVVELL